jgi:hypothetical protein
MGYTTEFYGHVTVTPPLSAHEMTYLMKFANTRRMDREKGPYYVDGKGYAGQDEEPDIRNYNTPPAGQPGLWCQWVPTPDGAAIEWNGAEKFYDADEWMQYLIDHFLKPGAIGKKTDGTVTFADHVVNGTIEAQGEDFSDIWQLNVKNNVVSIEQGVRCYR